MEVPLGVSLETYAAICAALAEGDRSQEQVLGEFGVAESSWEEVQVRWNRAIADDEMLNDGAGGLGQQYGEHFARAQDGLKPVPELTPEQWAEVTDDVARHGLRALAKHNMTEADHARLTRKWVGELASDRALAGRYNAALYARNGV